MCAEASTVLRAVAADFFFNCWYLEIPSDNRIRQIPRCKTFDWKRSRIFMMTGTDTHATMVELLEAMISVRSVTRL
jgi:hypothetical protein